MMIIEKASEEDFEKLQSLFKELDEYHVEIDPGRVKSYDGKSRNQEELFGYIEGDNAELFYCSLNGEMVGLANVKHCGIDEDRFRVGRAFVLLDNLYVRKEHRRKGIASALYREVCKWAAGRDTSSIEIQVFWQNEEAKSFYKSLGFTPVSVRMERNT